MIFSPKVKYTFTFLLVFFLIFQGKAVLAQTPAPWEFTFAGRVQHVDEKGKEVDLEGAVCTLTKSGTVVTSVTTGNKGKFSFKLDGNGDYVVSLTKPGFIVKKFAVSTRNVPEERAAHGFGPWDITIVIFEQYPGLDYSITNNPIAKVVYNPSKDVDDFTFDAAYTESMKSAIAKLEDLARAAREKDKSFASAMAAGDKAFQAKDYNGAKAQYTAAAAIKPNEQGPKDKIKDCDAAIADAAKKGAADADYKAAVAAGEAALGKKDYSGAQASYQKAATLKPDEKVPPQKLKDIADLIQKAKDDAASQGKYTDAMAKGDAAFKATKYEDAKSAYNDALAVKPKDPVATQKISDCNTALDAKNKADKLDASYKAALKKGDDAFTAKDYVTAKAGYTDASSIKPTEQYPKDRLKAIDDLSANKAKYDKAIAKGDAALKALKYDDAKAGYNEALTYVPKDAYATQKLTEIDAALASKSKQDKLDSDYKAAVKKGDDALAAKDYTKATAGYTAASTLKPSEQYPKDQLKAIGDLQKKANDAAANKAKYDAAILKGDAAVKATKYDDAKAAYNDALTAIPDDAIAKQKIKDVDALIQKLKGDAELKAKYDKAIATADAAFKGKTYEDAKVSYNEALGYKPAEQYPKDQLKLIDAAIKDAQAKAGLEKNYKDAIDRGDAAFKTKDWVKSKAGYTDALALKATEAYPKAQIKAIDDAIAADENKGKLEAKYQAALKKGDDAMKAKSYEDAKAGYTEATTLKPSEQYPKDQLKAIGDLQKKANDAAANKARYAAAILKGDAAVKATKYDDAKAAYNDALTAIPDDAIAKQKIKDVDALIQKLKGDAELKAKYDKAIATADAAFKGKTYEDAKASYNEALGYKPAEQYPKDQLKLIDAAIKDAQAKAGLEKNYKDAIDRGDAAFKTKDWVKSKAGYTDALALKATEAYPKAQIKAIDDAIAADENKGKLDAKYQAALKKGDDALKAKSYEDAKAGYTEASGVKPSEQYPKDKLKEIEGILSGQKKDAENKAKYDQAVAKGDKAFDKKDFTNAKAAFNEALTYKPDEQYPKEKLKEIDSAMAKDADARAKNQKYQDAVKKGDDAFQAKKYDIAKAGYNEALTIKSEEPYPAAQLKAIQALLDERDAKAGADKKYTDAINKADAAFKSKDYDNAKAGYNEALTYKASEPYPKTQLKAIDDLLKNQDKQKQLEEKYKALISTGDGAMSSKDYKAAKTSFTDASALKPAEQYPKDKLKEIDNILLNDSKNKLNEEKYAAAVKKGDDAFSAKSYPAAKTAYTEATSLKPGEKYPKDQLAAIDALMKGVSDEQAKNARYTSAIAKADAAFKAKKLEEAKSGYTEALGIKPGEEYPEGRLKEIEEMLLAEKNKNDLNGRYNNAIQKGEESLTAKNYGKAKSSFEEALSIKPGDVYAKSQLDKIAALLTKDENDRANAAKYSKIIQDGDRAFSKQDYPTAKAAFTEASGMRPTEMYPKDKLAAINAALAALDKSAEKEAKYKEAVSKGNGSYDSKEFSTARTFYSSALTYKPGDAYVTSRISDIDNKLAGQQYQQQQLKKYTDAIAKGDKAFKAKDYTNAKSAYQDAGALKPGEAYPKSQIQACDDALNKLNPKTTIVATVDPKAGHNPLVDKYPQGTTELSERVDGTCKVITRIVVKGTDAWTYEQKTYSFITYWFKDGVNITKATYDLETTPEK